MVDQLPNTGYTDDELNAMTDDQFEAVIAALPKRTEEEQQKDLEDFLNHPINAKKITPEMLERPEF